MRRRWLTTITWCKTCENTCNASWIASVPLYQWFEDIPLKAVSSSDQDCDGSLNDHMGTGTATISAGAAPAERTEQEQVRPAVPQTLMDQEVELACLTYAERKKKISRDKRLARYEHVLALHRAGMGQRAIARELQMSRRIVQRYLSSDGFPERAPGSGLRAPGKSKLDPYLVYLRERWSAGEHSGSRLFSEIKERGYHGSESLLRHVLGEWRTELPSRSRQGSPRKLRLVPRPRKRRLSSRGAAFLMILSPSKLTKVQQQQVEQMNLNEDLHAVYPLSPGVCHPAQRTPGGGIGLLAHASQSVPCERTGQ